MGCWPWISCSRDASHAGGRAADGDKNSRLPGSSWLINASGRSHCPQRPAVSLLLSIELRGATSAALRAP